MADKPPASDAFGDEQHGVTNLAVINFENLLLKDAAEVETLYSACEKWGFFYLDLSGDAAKEYLQNVANLFSAAKEYFAKPLDEKLRDTRKELDIYNICGYKPLGPLGLDEGNMNRKRNGSENLRECPPDPSRLSSFRLSFPKGMQEHQEQISGFINKSRFMAMLILESLSDYLKLEGDERFEAFHKSGELSTSSAVMQHYPLTDLPSDTSAGHFTHTDTGSITVLFNTDWGLQVFSPETEQWEYVPPRDQCAVINVGDSLKFISKFRLKSSLHRVIPSSDRWSSGSRYASIYFLRSSNDTRFTDTEGVEWTAHKWLTRKFQNYRFPHVEQEKNAISTGRKGFAGLWDGAKDRAV
ncbi:2OG-Fe(II) oxygenase family oxidoreductase [Coniochaeta ligniaria NRRL 30616]|uniref:2OG-Fe(II) oxygenase family oxidoreductase n=1 Tax=Coniochaeta ligniaria NRRL 30616 TaxID=1408157 RepID=A0A1J7JCH4_9PEZI|nr:2OG-Fe(II) oxygenase family oxidoreductase [Coniochaeta ligniaria NRRL 30616]